LRSGSQILGTPAGTIEFALRGQGAPLMVVHGGGGGYDQALVIARKMGGDYQVIAPSRFGYLRSPQPSDSSPAAQADLFAALLDYLKLDKIAILGESAGGPSAIQFALRHPDRCWALMLFSAINQPLSARFNDIVEQARRMADYVPDFGPWLVHKIVGPSAATWLLRGLNISQDSDIEFVDAILQAGFPLSERLKGTLSDFDHFKHTSTAPLEEIRTPTLVTHGTGDALVPYEQGRAAAERIPQAEFISIPGGSHIWMATHGAETIPQILAFLGKHAPRSNEVD
jgi:pimeloyl-ACP methyl ester carboxylesterase